MKKYACFLFFSCFFFVNTVLAYYSPAQGRWLSRDPIEETGGVNLYQIVGNDTINAFDPYGLKEYTMHFDFLKPSEFTWYEKLSEPSGKHYVKSINDIYEIIKNTINKDECDCIKSLNISAHGHGAGNIVLGDTYWYNFDYYLLNRNDDELTQRLLSKKQTMQQAVMAFSEVSKYLCEKPKITFIICGAGEGEPGEALRVQLSKVFPSGAKITLFPGECGYAFGIPLAKTGEPGKISN